MKIYDDIPYFDGHNDVLLKLYSIQKIKLRLMILLKAMKIITLIYQK